MITSGQCGSAGTTCVASRGLAFGGRLAGSVMRVVERLPSAAGTPAGVAKASTAARHWPVLTISIWMAPSGHALTQAGACPASSRPWHMSHLPTTPRSGLYCGTP